MELPADEEQYLRQVRLFQTVWWNSIPYSDICSTTPLVKNGLQHFDAWASTFGETVTAIELTPEVTGYRAKTRFAKFYNLPELMAMFKEVADIKTDMLNLPVPEAEYHNVSVEPSEMQKEMVASLQSEPRKFVAEVWIQV